MPIEEGGLMAAVNAGIAEASSAPTPEPSAPADTGADDAQLAAATPSADGGEDHGAGGEGGEAAPAGDAPAGDVPATGDDVPADGAAAADAAKPAGSPEGTPEPVKPPDPLNDPLPNALKKETKERINTLISMVKETSAKAETVERNFNELYGAITETKASPEQYGQALEYLRMVNSPNRADREQALDFMQREMAALARMLGKPVPGVNMLEGHQDLIDEVSTGRLSQERAQEIAAARSAAQHELRVGHRQREAAERQQQEQQARAQGVQQLNALGAQLKAIEPAVYEAKRALLVESLKPVFAQIPPSQWAATFKRAYDNLKLPSAPPPPPPTPRIPTNTPLRASNPAGGATPAPKSLQEAIELGIAQASG